ncbi:MAG: M57 family metalloprotease, partial [Bacteroidota bacterium]
MANFIKTMSRLTILSVLALACQEQELPVNKVPAEVIENLKAAGFSTGFNLRPFGNGYLVENDILLTAEQIRELGSPVSAGKFGSEEHYRTNNIVTRITTVNVWMDPGFGSAIYNEFLAALARYNAENLTLKFNATTSKTGADIQIVSFYENSNTLGVSAGFPSKSGTPASPIQLNTKYYNSTSVRADTKTVIAHEIGHAIGFRHTDYMDRSFSCGGSAVN